MAQKNPVPEARKPRTPVRMPQRSEEVAGDEQEGTTPIAAVQKKTEANARPPQP